MDKNDTQSEDNSGQSGLNGGDSDVQAGSVVPGRKGLDRYEAGDDNLYFRLFISSSRSSENRARIFKHWEQNMKI